MKKEALGKCPVCNKNLNITRLECNHCNTIIEGDFTQCKFCKLNNDQKSFVEVFIKNRGNIKEIEKELGISYPTVRNKLENIINALGHKPKPQPKLDKKEILSKLSAGEITADEAIKLLS
ncbi:DUF2089 domain-containing protein [Clostridium sp. D2Q-14]|uniref:DUF2089 domain-containing protein n=1 Tax=Anaeromonas gelatinilytica TaxID=2683194 RepID=UPI00193C155D|nr:DUF2089 domain-containing protein [Anaeromonas gelatinilytica]MBS4534404.1 DUF2089 domain-containing protein [Anaeromonas gelatinilytica]